MKKRRSFSREFKREAAGMVLDQGFSYREVCRVLPYFHGRFENASGLMTV